ncbi:MAG: uroporphyrinogen decarboxylase family protein [Planctomycetaceae bacterium]|nr:hypothetical protein [Planctomycetaceae bacterium]
MPLTHRENFLRNASMQGHEWIPMGVYISGNLWYHMGEELEDLCLRHPVLWPNFKKGQTPFKEYGKQAPDRYDMWGCKWRYELGGLDGQVIEHPLARWDAFDEWKKTTPKPPSFTDDDRKRIAEAKAKGDMTGYGYGPHGFFFMQLYYLRGFENFMMDVATEEPRLDELIEILASYWEASGAGHIAEGVDLVSAADDQGTQRAHMLGPKYFRRYLMPTYQRLFQPARKSGAHVYMHTDGYIMDIAEDLLACGLSIVNPQDLVNGIDNLAKVFKGRVCIQCDIDRQSVLPYGSPADVHELIKEEVMKLGSPAGGLEFIVGLYHPTPMANIEALCTALEKYRTYWVGR